jgi:hypothetical protein
MFVQVKTANGKQYIYIIESYRKDDGSISHRTIEKLGRLDDFIKDDPQALEKLKEKVRESTHELKQANTIERVTKINTIYNSRSLLTSTEGLPQLNYSNFVIRMIWNEILDLDYRINYLQNRYHKNLKFNLSRVLRRAVTKKIIDTDNIDLKLGTEYSFLGDNFDASIDRSHFQFASRVISENYTNIIGFVAKRLEEHLDLAFLTKTIPALNQEKIDAMASTATLAENITFDSDLNEMPITHEARTQHLLNILVTVILQIIQTRVNARHHNYSIDNLRTALQKALLIICYPPVPNGKFSYIKANNGRYALIMNSILRAFELEPMLNVQDRVEMAKRLRTKFKNDNAAIPQSVMRLFLNKGEGYI